MKNERNRKRPIQVKFFVNAAELESIKQRMAEFGMDNLSAYLCKMALEGACENTKADTLFGGYDEKIRLRYMGF